MTCRMVYYALMSQMSKEQLHDTIRNDILNLTLKPGSVASICGATLTKPVLWKLLDP